MTHRFTRRELYELVWSQPMRTVAASVGISDVALAKHCRKARIPVPERGYWARKSAGKPTIKRPLPPRFPGENDHLEFGATSYWNPNWRAAVLSEPVPPPPHFDEPIETVADRVRRMVGKVACPRALTSRHPLIATLLDQEEKQRVEFPRFRINWNGAQHDSALQMRRFRILNAIFSSLERLGCKPMIGTAQYRPEDERDLGARIGNQTVHFSLEPIKSRRPQSGAGKPKQRLRFTISGHHS
jgi:hypothetical protein